MIELIFSYIMLNVIASILGYKEGILYSRMGADSFKWDEHQLYIVERFSMALAYLSATQITSTEALIMLILWGLSFSFWHDGFYYISRNRIDVKWYHFTSNSTTSTAKFEITWRIRLIMKILSVILFVFFFIVLPVRRQHKKEMMHKKYFHSDPKLYNT